MGETTPASYPLLQRYALQTSTQRSLEIPGTSFFSLLFFYIAPTYRHARIREHTFVCNPKYELYIRKPFKRTYPAVLGGRTNLIKSPRASFSPGERAPRGMKGSYFINDGPPPYDGGVVI